MHEHDGAPEHLLWLRLRAHPGVEVIHAQRSSRQWRVFQDSYSFGALLLTRNSERAYVDWRYRNQSHRLMSQGTAFGEPGETQVARDPTPHADYDVVRIDPHLFVETARALGWKQPEPPHFPAAQTYDPDVVAAVQRVRATFVAQANGDGHGDATAAIANLVRLVIERHVGDAIGEATAPPPGRRVVRRARERLVDGWNLPLSMEDVARDLGVSPYYLAHAFSQEVGIPPLQFQLQVRLDRARRLLRESSESVTEIAMRCGFADTSYFDRQFKRRFGVTPSAYRAATR
jgi:AraC-like DNA-binding protein